MSIAEQAIPEGVKVARKYIEKLEADQFGWDIAVGDAFVRGMRDIGYKSTAFSLAELVDNSLQADPSRIDILFGFENGKKPTQIAIVDDGHGMDPKMIRASLVWGAGTRAENPSGFGKYGYGLPSASVSQCHRVTVYSRTMESEWHSAYLDIDEIKEGRENWIKENRIEMPTQVAAEPPKFVMDHLKRIGSANHGTVVVWEKELDRVEPKTRDNLRGELLMQLGVIYRRFLVNTPMTVDGQKVEPCDPLFLTEGYRYYDLDGDRAIEYPSAVVEVSDRDSGKTIGQMRIRYSRMPASFFRKPEAKHTNKPGPGKTNERLEIAEANTGIIFMRNGRQIDAIRPPRSFRSVNQTTDRFWAVEVDFDASLDELFSITTSKQQVNPDKRIWDILKDKAGMFSAIATMFRDYLKDAAEIAAKVDADKESQRASVAAIEAARKFKTGPAPKDTAERRKEAQDNLYDEVQRRAGMAGIEPEIVERELVAARQGDNHAVETEDLPGAPFFRCEQRGGIRVLSINRSHPFFDQLYMAPGATPRTRAVLEVLLWTLGEAEVDADPFSDRRHFYERERSSVWTPYLDDSLQMLKTMSIVEDEPEVMAAEDEEPAA